MLFWGPAAAEHTSTICESAWEEEREMERSIWKRSIGSGGIVREGNRGKWRERWRESRRQSNKEEESQMLCDAVFSNPFRNAAVDRRLCPGTWPIPCCLSPRRLIRSLADFCHCCTGGMTQEINLYLHKGCFSSHTSLLNNSSKHTHAYFGSSSRTFNKISELSNWTH